MDKAKKCKKTYTIAALTGFSVIAISLAFIYVFYIRANYMLLIPFSVLSIIGCYVTVFSSFAAYDAGIALKIILIIQDIGDVDISLIADRMGWNKRATVKFLNNCKKHGYIL